MADHRRKHPSHVGSTTALLVVDLQNGFCHPEGSFARLGADTSMCRAAVAGCADLVAAARTAGASVVWVRKVHAQDHGDAGLLARRMPGLRTLGGLVGGTWDADLVDEVRPLAGEPVVDKRRFSAFHDTALGEVLLRRGVVRLVVCGVTTDVCVDSTVRDASQRDYPTVVVSDATGALSADRHEAALDTLGTIFAEVLTVSATAKAWLAPARLDPWRPPS